jgi:hypothetical protein
LIKPKRKEKPKDEVEGMIATVVKPGHCCWVPKSNYNKENETKTQKRGRREGFSIPPP